MVCQVCLRENDPFAKYCCDCGRGLTGQSAEPAPSVIGVWSDRARRCTSCGETIPARSRFCSECGAAPAVAPRRGRNTRLLMGLVVVGVVVIVAAFAALLIPGHFG